MVMMMASKEKLTDTEYVSKQGYVCPNCHSDEITETDCFNRDDNYGWQNCSCEICGARWRDIWHLSGYDSLEIPEITKEGPQNYA
jgi:hypothetical protein